MREDIQDLIHHGVKGQKWGVRNDVKKVRRTAQEERKTDRLTMRSQAKTNFKGKMGVYKMSDDELKSKINRLQMESQYMSLSDNQMNYHRNVGSKFMRAMVGIGNNRSGVDAASNWTKKGASLASSKVAAAGGPKAIIAGQVLKQMQRNRERGV